VNFTEYDSRLAGYAVLVDADDRVLLALWNEGTEPLWTMPGGGIELHESIEQGVVREVREETGYDVELGPLLGIDTYLIPTEKRLAGEPRPLRGIRVVYAATITGGELTHEIDGTTDEARWFRRFEVADLPRSTIVDVALGFLLE
jgi:8-oxo-dGTP diphosphatase